MRRLIRAANEISDSAFLPEGRTSAEVLDAAEQRVFEIGEERLKESGPRLVGPLVQEALDKIHELANSKNPITGLASGFSDLDRKTAGFQNSELIIIAARPSMGKTALMVNIAEHAVMSNDSGGAVLVFSLEQPADQLVMRMLSSLGRIDQTAMRIGNLKDADWDRFDGARMQLKDQPLFIDDTAALTPNDVRARSRRVAREAGGLKMIMVDYLQLMRPSRDQENRTNEISEISRSLKAIAKEMKCPLIACSQLNRGVENRPNKRPHMSDLRESGAIEQDADVIIFIYRDEVYNEETEDKGIAEIIIGKQRNGPIGTIKLRLLARTHQVREPCRERPLRCAAPRWSRLRPGHRLPLMAKAKVAFVCGDCGAEHGKWQGQCTGCGEWNTLREFILPKAQKRSSGGHGPAGYAGDAPRSARLVEIDTTTSQRIPSGFAELDRVLGGGFVPGSVALIGGDPGAGKSTLLLQVSTALDREARVLYVSGEESLEQIADRARRLELAADELTVASEVTVERVAELVQAERPALVVVDSIQVMQAATTESLPGSVTQVRESAAQLVRLAKQTGVAVVLVGHVTKEGNLAGPKVLEHMIDCFMMLDGPARQPLPHPARLEEPVRRDQRTGRVRHDRCRHEGGVKSFRHLPATAAGDGTGKRGDRHLGRHPTVAGGDPGAGRRRPGWLPQARRGWPRCAAPGHAPRRSASTLRRVAGRPGRVRQRRGRGAHRRNRCRSRAFGSRHVELQEPGAATGSRRVRRTWPDR